MGWEFRPSNRSAPHFNSTNDSLGKIITSRAFDGIRRYSIYSQAQPCDLTINVFVRWPLVRDIGSEPTFAQKIAALGSHPFWLNKSLQTIRTLPMLWRNVAHLIFGYMFLTPFPWLLPNPDLMGGL